MFDINKKPMDGKCPPDIPCLVDDRSICEQNLFVKDEKCSEWAFKNREYLIGLHHEFTKERRAHNQLAWQYAHLKAFIINLINEEESVASRGFNILRFVGEFKIKTVRMRAADTVMNAKNRHCAKTATFMSVIMSNTDIRFFPMCQKWVAFYGDHYCNGPTLGLLEQKKYPDSTKLKATYVCNLDNDRKVDKDFIAAHKQTLKEKGKMKNEQKLDELRSDFKSMVNYLTVDDSTAQPISMFTDENSQTTVTQNCTDTVWQPYQWYSSYQYMSKLEQAFKVINVLIDNKMIKVNSVPKFIKLVNEIAKVI
jgi:hypothetical protein